MEAKEGRRIKGMRRRGRGSSHQVISATGVGPRAPRNVLFSFSDDTYVHNLYVLCY